jgi:hypothetical protein
MAGHIHIHHASHLDEHTQYLAFGEVLTQHAQRVCACWRSKSAGIYRLFGTAQQSFARNGKYLSRGQRFEQVVAPNLTP